MEIGIVDLTDVVALPTPAVVLQDLLNELHRILIDGSSGNTAKSQVLALTQALATLQSAVASGLKSSLAS